MLGYVNRLLTSQKCIFHLGFSLEQGHRNSLHLRLAAIIPSKSGLAPASQETAAPL